MSFTQLKDWRNATTHSGGGDTSTPLSAVAIEDLELRTTSFAPITTNLGEFASGDGVTDVTSAFEDARDDAGVGGHLYIPPGTYILDGVALNLASQRWSLAPSAILKLKDSSTSEFIFDLDAEGIMIEGGELDGNFANNGGASDYSYLIGIHAGGARVRDIYAHDGAGFSVLGMPSGAAVEMSDVEVNNVRSIDCVQGGVYFNYATPTTPSAGIRILNCWSDNSALAVATIKGGGGGVYCQDATTDANQPRDVVVHGVYAKCRVDAVIETAGVGATNLNGVHISDCHTEDQSFAGFTLVANHELQVSTCSDHGSVTFGFEIVGAVSGGNGDTGSGVISGCAVEGKGVTGCGFMLNACTDTALTGCEVRYGLNDTNAAGIAISNPDDLSGTGVISVCGNTIHTFHIGISDTDLSGQGIQISNNVINLYGGGPANGVGINVDWTDAASGSRYRVYNNNLIKDFDVGIQFYNANVVRTFSDVIARWNSLLNTSSHIAKDANITFDASCSIEDETLLGWAV